MRAENVEPESKMAPDVGFGNTHRGDDDERCASEPVRGDAGRQARSLMLRQFEKCGHLIIDERKHTAAASGEAGPVAGPRGRNPARPALWIRGRMDRIAAKRLDLHCQLGSEVIELGLDCAQPPVHQQEGAAEFIAGQFDAGQPVFQFERLGCHTGWKAQRRR